MCDNNLQNADQLFELGLLHTPLREITSTGEFEQLFRLN